MYFHRVVDVFHLWMNPVLRMSHCIIHSTDRLIKTLIKDGHLFRSQMNQLFWMNWFWTNGRCVQNCILCSKYCIWFETCFTSLPFTTSLPWPHGIVKCPLDMHNRILTEVVSYSGTFHLLFYEYYEFGLTAQLILLYSMEVDIIRHIFLF